MVGGVFYKEEIMIDVKGAVVEQMADTTGTSIGRVCGTCAHWGFRVYQQDGSLAEGRLCRAPLPESVVCVTTTPAGGCQGCAVWSQASADQLESRQEGGRSELREMKML